MEKMMIRCFTWVPISGLGKPNYTIIWLNLQECGDGFRFWTAVINYLEKLEGTLPLPLVVQPFFMKPNLPLPIPVLVFMSFVTTFG